MGEKKKCMFDVFSVGLGLRETKYIPTSIMQLTNFSNDFEKVHPLQMRVFCCLFTSCLLLLPLHQGQAVEKGSCLFQERHSLGLASILVIGARRRP